MNQIKRSRLGEAARVDAVTSADILAAGIRVTGVVQHVASTGMTAAGLAADEGDDPLIHVTFVYSDGAGTTHRCESMLRVPDGKAHYLVPGNPIPVTFVPYDPTQAAIDWSRLV